MMFLPHKSSTHTGSKCFFTGCPSNYEEHDESCYKLVTTPTSRTAAQTACEADGTNLVTVDDAAENEFVKGKYR